ncbi:MAG: C-GCAxxG-C-C family protein [Thermoplasmata archaeon]|nr:C-GCAxxG-C-C family protein [Thermoplasmata archaeon]
MRDVEEGVEHASACFAGGFNCAESVLRGVCLAQGLDTPEACLRMATPFGGGVGRAEDICGALAGGVMGIGAAVGRTSPGEDKARAYDAANALFKGFAAAFGSVRCRDLNKGDFKSPEHSARCTGFVREATRMAVLAARESRG